MEPRIQYAKTSDGVSIAYAVSGEGPPLVHMPWHPFGHVQLEWQFPEVRRWYESLAHDRMLVRYDGRGAGLSERDVSDFSLEKLVADLEAVADGLALESFVLFAALHSGPAAIVYAARHTTRVSNLLLWCSYSRPPDSYRSPAYQALLALIPKDWELFTETLAHVRLGWSEGPPARRFAELIRESVRPEVVQQFVAAVNDVDVSSMLPEVSSRTLVLCRREIAYLEEHLASNLASGIRDARLVMLDGSSVVPYLGDTDAALRAIDEFLGREPEVRRREVGGGTAIILFADIADSTGLTEQLGDAAFRDRSRALDEALRALIRETGGKPVEGKLLGDGLMAVFTSAREAIECALRCSDAGGATDLRLHLGVHAGDVIHEADNVYGGAVNIASRVAGMSAPGQVLVSDIVRGLARTSTDVSFVDRGEHELKGVSDPVRLYEVRWRE